MASNTKRINITFDLICFMLVLVLFIMIKTLIYGTNEGLYPTKRGFLCGDRSIQWPFKESTIPPVTNNVLSYIIPIVVVSFQCLYHGSKDTLAVIVFTKLLASDLFICILNDILASLFENERN